MYIVFHCEFKGREKLPQSIILSKVKKYGEDIACLIKQQETEVLKQ
jgi:hypothetical protein